MKRFARLSSRVTGRRAFCTAVISVALLATVGSASGQTAPTSGDQVWDYLASLPKEQRLSVLSKEAAREGGLVVYGALGIDKAQVFLELFRATYPDVKIDFVRLRGPELAEKLLLEYRTERVNSDAVISDLSFLDIIKDALAPYEPTTWSEFEPTFLAGAKNEGWTAVVWEMLPTTIAWRTDRISQDEAPRTLEEVMDPKWKGRTGATTLLERFIDAMIVGYGEEIALEKVKKLAALENRLYQSTAALSEALAAGQIDIAWNFNAHRPYGLKEQGAPIDFVYQDPLHGSGDTVSVVRNAKHPYAGALFMEFLTDAKVLEKTESIEGGRLFGNRKGNFENKLSNFPNLIPFRSLSPERFAELNKIAVDLFLRR